MEKNRSSAFRLKRATQSSIFFGKSRRTLRPLAVQEVLNSRIEEFGLFHEWDMTGSRNSEQTGIGENFNPLFCSSHWQGILFSLNGQVPA